MSSYFSRLNSLHHIELETISWTRYNKFRDFRFKDIAEIYEIIKNDHALQTITDKILRNHIDGIKDGWKKVDKQFYQKDKANNLPAVTFSITKRRDHDISNDPLEHTGLINLDLDENTKEELDQFASVIIPTLPFIEACGLSVSGEVSGGRWVNARIRIPDSYDRLPPDIKALLDKESWVEGLHKLFHFAISELFAKFGIKVGNSAKDLKRVRYLCHDSNLYINNGSVPLMMEDCVLPLDAYFSIKEKDTKYRGEKNAEAILEWVIQQSGLPVKGDRTCKYVRYFGICNSHGIPLDDAIQVVSQYGGEYQHIGEEVYARYTDQHNSHKVIKNQKNKRYTDLKNAKIFANTYKEKLLYSTEADSWYFYNGNNWERDRVRKAESWCKQTVEELIAHEEASDDKTLLKSVRKLESRSRISNMVELSKSELPVLLEDFDGDNWVLNVKNGELDLQNLKLLPHRPESRISKIANAEYDKDATAPAWDKFLSEIFNDDHELIKFVRKSIGYACTGDITEQVIFFLYGTGANGKSTLVNVILNILGDYGQQMPATSLLLQKNDRIPADIARLNGCRFVSSGETGALRKIDESLIKQLTGGDKLVARFMRENFFEFIPTHKIFLATNHKPIISGSDNGIWRRIRLIPFTVTIPPQRQDKNLEKKLLMESPGILNWIIEGIRLWLEEGLEPASAVRTATEAYRNEMDTLGEFISDFCISEKNKEIKSSELYEYYKTWCEKNNELVLSIKEFGLKLEEKNYERKKRKDGNYWLGIEVTRQAKFLLSSEIRKYNTEMDSCVNY